MPTMTLSQIVQSLDLPTDKLRDQEFSKHRYKPISLLEVGVHRGGSIHLWDQYFKRAKRIIGIDTDLSQVWSRDTLSERVELVTASAYDKGIVDSLGDFDIIIDDCLHDVESQVKFLELYFPRLKPEGVLVIEDIWDAEKDLPRLLATLSPNVRYETKDYRANGKHIDDYLLIVRA